MKVADLAAQPGRFGGFLRAERVQLFAYRVALVLLLIVGIGFRSQRYWVNPIGLWADEAGWGMRLFTHPLTNMMFRPIGYMAITKLFVHFYSDPRTLRILSYVTGIASLFIAADLGKRLLRSRWSRLLFVGVLAFHPLLIDMAREFKPYSVEFCAHLGLVWLFVRWRQSRSRRWFAALLICSVLTFLLAYNIVFLLPAIFTLLGVTFLRERAHRRLLVTIAAALVALAVIGGVYSVALRWQTDDDAESTDQFWGRKYDVFYLAGQTDSARQTQGRAHWVARKYLGLAAFPDAQRDRWRFPKWVSASLAQRLTESDIYVWAALHLFGLIALCRRGRRDLLVLLTLPVLVTLAFNLLGKWPFGVFRANTFLLAYFIPIAMVGLDAVVSRRGVLGWVGVFAGCFLVLILNLTVGFDWHRRKYFFTDHSEAAALLVRLKELREQEPVATRGEREFVLMDSYSCGPLMYYSRYDDGTHRVFGDYLSQNFRFKCLGRASRSVEAMHKLHGRLFFVVATDEREKPMIRRMVHRETNVLDEEQVAGTHDLYHVTGVGRHHAAESGADPADP